MPVSTAWRLTILDMQGRTVVNAQGVGNGNVATVSASGLRPGAYIATLIASGEQNRFMVIKTAHAGVR